MRKDEPTFTQLNNFLKSASNACYAGGGTEITPERADFHEFEFSDGDLHYRDSYSGLLASWGTELVRYKGIPFWTVSYGGGMVVKSSSIVEFAHKTFGFLKQVLSLTKGEEFQPRGPESYQDQQFGYNCKWEKNILDFAYEERITWNLAVVFKYRGIGGRFID
jgi:hypothetical protein